MWKNTEVPDRPHITVWRMRTVRWIPKAAHTRPEYVILICFFFPLQQWFALPLPFTGPSCRLTKRELRDNVRVTSNSHSSFFSLSFCSLCPHCFRSLSLCSFPTSVFTLLCAAVSCL